MLDGLGEIKLWAKIRRPQMDGFHASSRTLFQQVLEGLSGAIWGSRILRLTCSVDGACTKDHITPLLQAGKNMLIVGHEASVNAAWLHLADAKWTEMANGQR